MIDRRARDLIDGYDTHNTLLHRFAEGLSNDESLRQPPFTANTFNWLLGHILSTRQEVLLTLDQPPLWPDGTGGRYATGSPPLTDAAEAVSLDDLMAQVDRSRGLLQIALEGGSAEYLEAIIGTRFGPRPRIEHIAGLQWHETYHLGQLELLRAMILDGRPAG
jgi:hypothetical protein